MAIRAIAVMLPLLLYSTALSGEEASWFLSTESRRLLPYEPITIQLCVSNPNDAVIHVTAPERILAGEISIKSFASGATIFRSLKSHNFMKKEGMLATKTRPVEQGYLLNRGDFVVAVSSIVKPFDRRDALGDYSPIFSNSGEYAISFHLAPNDSGRMLPPCKVSVDRPTPQEESAIEFLQHNPLIAAYLFSPHVRIPPSEQQGLLVFANLYRATSYSDYAEFAVAKSVLGGLHLGSRLPLTDREEALILISRVIDDELSRRSFASRISPFRLSSDLYLQLDQYGELSETKRVNLVEDIVDEMVVEPEEAKYALELLNGIDSAFPFNEYVRILQSRCYLHLSDHERSRRAISTLVVQRPHHVTALELLRVVYRTDDQWQALRVLKYGDMPHQIVDSVFPGLETKISNP